MSAPDNSSLAMMNTSRSTSSAKVMRPCTSTYVTGVNVRDTREEHLNNKSKHALCRGAFQGIVDAQRKRRSLVTGALLTRQAENAPGAQSQKTLLSIQRTGVKQEQENPSTKKRTYRGCISKANMSVIFLPSLILPPSAFSNLPLCICMLSSARYFTHLGLPPPPAPTLSTNILQPSSLSPSLVYIHVPTPTRLFSLARVFFRRSCHISHICHLTLCQRSHLLFGLRCTLKTAFSPCECRRYGASSWYPEAGTRSCGRFARAE